MKMVNIRVDEKIWERFKKVARAQESDASKEIRKFIKRYVIEHSELFLQLEAQEVGEKGKK